MIMEHNSMNRLRFLSVRQKPVLTGMSLWVLLFLFFVRIGSGQTFGDVPLSAPWYATSAFMYSAGITTGCQASPLLYCPDRNLTRGEMAVFVIRAINYKTTGSADPPSFTYTTTPYFTDVPSNHGFFKYIQKMKDLGITGGCTTITYCPDAQVTNEQVAVFAVRGRQIADTGFVNNSISCPLDFSCSDYFGDSSAATTGFFYNFIQKAREIIGPTLGVDPACPGGNFCPLANITRGWMSLYVAVGIAGRCYYPCWSTVAPSAFVAQRYPTGMTAPPSPSSPYQWILPIPVQPFTPFYFDTTPCNANDNYVDGIGNSYPMTLLSTASPIPRQPSYIYRSVFLTNVRGIGIQASFTGATIGGGGLVEAVFYHSQQCFSAGVEFGFQRIVDATAKTYIQFTHSVYTNCASNCSITFPSGTVVKSQSPDYLVQIPIPAGLNDVGGTDWIYEASLSPDATNWIVEVISPSTFRVAWTSVPNTPIPVQSYFTDYAKYVKNGGMSGYITLTSSLLQNPGFPPPTPPATQIDYLSTTMNIVNVFAP